MDDIKGIGEVRVVCAALIVNGPPLRRACHICPFIHSATEDMLTKVGEIRIISGRDLDVTLFIQIDMTAESDPAKSENSRLELAVLGEGEKTSPLEMKRRNVSLPFMDDLFLRILRRDKRLDQHIKGNNKQN